MNYAAIIAAAGVSSRSHHFKPMMWLEQETIIQNIIDVFISVGIKEIVVVGGYKSYVLFKHIEKKPVRFIENKNFEATKMMDSVKLGLDALSFDYDFIFISRGDTPLLNKEIIVKLMESGACIARPGVNGHAGRPIMVSSEKINEMLTCEDGLRGFLKKNQEIVKIIEVNDESVLLDADVPEDYKKLCQYSRSNRSDGKLVPELSVRIMKSEIILSNESVRLLEMIDQMGSIQAACASVHISYTKGWNMIKKMEKELGFNLVVRYSGGEYGGGSELSKRGREFIKAYHCYMDELNAQSQRMFQKYFLEFNKGDSK